MLDFWEKLSATHSFTNFRMRKRKMKMRSQLLETQRLQLKLPKPLSKNQLFAVNFRIIIATTMINTAKLR